MCCYKKVVIYLTIYVIGIFEKLLNSQVYVYGTLNATQLIQSAEWQQQKKKIRKDK